MGPSAGAPLAISHERPDAVIGGYALLSPKASGTYDVSIFCEWNPHRSLRWLRGFGHATYALTLRVPAS